MSQARSVTQVGSCAPCFSHSWTPKTSRVASDPRFARKIVSGTPTVRKTIPVNTAAVRVGRFVIRRAPW